MGARIIVHHVVVVKFVMIVEVVKNLSYLCLGIKIYIIALWSEHVFRHKVAQHGEIPENIKLPK